MARFNGNLGKSWNARLLAWKCRLRLILYNVLEEYAGMKAIVAFLVLSLSFHAYGQSPKPATLRSILLEQLRTTPSKVAWQPIWNQ